MFSRMYEWKKISTPFYSSLQKAIYNGKKQVPASEVLLFLLWSGQLHRSLWTDWSWRRWTISQFIKSFPHECITTIINMNRVQWSLLTKKSKSKGDKSLLSLIRLNRFILNMVLLKMTTLPLTQPLMIAVFQIEIRVIQISNNSEHIKRKNGSAVQSWISWNHHFKSLRLFNRSSAFPQKFWTNLVE